MRTLFITWLLLLLCQFAFSQNNGNQTRTLIEGMVADSASFRALPYVNVFIKKTAYGTQTDSNGKFRIEARPTDTLTFSLVGYKPLHIPLFDWESGIVFMSEVTVMLNSVTIEGKKTDLSSYYGKLFADKNNLLQKQNQRLPFYYTKRKKEGIKINRFKNENNRVSTYLEVVINNDELKNMLIKKHSLSENEYYSVLEKFNEKNHMVMYYLTQAELLTLIYDFFGSNTSR